MLRAYREGLRPAAGALGLRGPAAHRQPPGDAAGGAGRRRSSQGRHRREPQDTAGWHPPRNPWAAPGAAPGAAGKAPGSVIREGDLDTRVTGQAGPQGSVRTRPGTRMPTQVPRGSREWERPEPTIQYPSDPSEEIQPPVPAPGQVITTPPPGGIYYRPGVQSTGRLNRQVVPEQREGRG